VAYPNPANNSVTISFDATSAGRYFYELSDLSGKLLLKKQVNVSQGIRNETFDLQPYAKGTYLISVVKPNNIKESIKVIRQ
jgi:hypothetical protein